MKSTFAKHDNSPYRKFNLLNLLLSQHTIAGRDSEIAPTELFVL